MVTERITMPKSDTEFSSWKDMAIYYKRLWLDEHQRFIAQNQTFEDLQNEFDALIRKRNIQVEELKLKEINSDYAAIRDINEIVKSHKKKDYFKITWQVVTLVLGILFFYVFVSRADFRQSIMENLIPLAIIAAVFGGLYFILNKNNAIPKKKGGR